MWTEFYAQNKYQNLYNKKLFLNFKNVQWTNNCVVEIKDVYSMVNNALRTGYGLVITIQLHSFTKKIQEVYLQKYKFAIYLIKDQDNMRQYISQ